MLEISEHPQDGPHTEGTPPPPLDVLQFALDASGCIRSANPAAADLFSILSGTLEGRAFDDVLREYNPDWAALLPLDLNTRQAEPLFLPWGREDQPGLGWSVHLLQAGTETGVERFLSLVPGLAPDISAAATEEGLGGPVGPALQNLFFRTRQMEARFGQFLRLLPGVPYAQGRDLSFSYRNEQLRLLLGKAFSRLEAGESWLDWIHPEDRPVFERSLDSCLSSRAPTGTRFRLQPDPTDRIFYILDLRIPVRSISGEVTGFEGLWLDLTRQTIAEKRLQRAAWKESLAEVTGSLSHDFNNILTGIVNLSDLMCMDGTGEDAPGISREDMEIIHSSAKQAQQLIQRIVSLNRENVGEIGLHNLVDIVRHQRDLIRIILPRNVEFTVDLPDIEIPVRIDRSAIRRILINFATNARDALRYRGQVEVLLQQVDLAGYPRDHLFSDRCGPAGQAAELIFRDNGCGIDPKILHRIFSPYFSTKDASRGSGLGLYSMTQFAQENGFDFGVRSRVGEGTDMILLIPVETIDLFDPPQPEEEPLLKKRVRSRPVGGMRVALYAQLDESIVLLTRELLSAGIHVENFEDPKTACRWLAEEAQEGDLFVKLMDHRKHCSEEVFEHLRRVDQRIRRFLLVRGFDPDEISHLGGDVFDQIFQEHTHPSENMRMLVQQLAIPFDEPSPTD